MTTWITDDKNNRCSVEYFGSEERARAALNSLRYCSYCSNCSDCSDSCRETSKVGDTFDIPTVEGIHSKVFAAASQEGALEMGRWHTCGTTHCRGGWAVTIAGPKGGELEARVGSDLAARLIYRESSPIRIQPGAFYKNEDEAMADMKRCADLEAEQARALDNG